MKREMAKMSAKEWRSKRKEDKQIEERRKNNKYRIGTGSYRIRD